MKRAARSIVNVSVVSLDPCDRQLKLPHCVLAGAAALFEVGKYGVTWNGLPRGIASGGVARRDA